MGWFHTTKAPFCGAVAGDDDRSGGAFFDFGGVTAVHTWAELRREEEEEEEGGEREEGGGGGGGGGGGKGGGRREEGFSYGG